MSHWTAFVHWNTAADEHDQSLAARATGRGSRLNTHAGSGDLAGHEKEARPTAWVASDLLRHPDGPNARAPLLPTVRRWSWLVNTYWYVPTTNLAAVLYNGRPARQIR